jgi:hypothetical protein
VQYDHHYTNTSSATVAAVLSAGMDSNCDWFVDSSIQGALDDGAVNEQDVDKALGHLLGVRMRLGEFDPPALNPYNKIPISAIGSVEHTDLALDAAEQGFVLLANANQTLPLSVANLLEAHSPGGESGGVLALIGPNAVAADTQLGNYHGVPASPIDIKTGITNLLTQMQTSELSESSSAAVTVGYEQGCAISGGSTKDPGFDKAVALASDKRTAAVVLAVGLNGNQEAEGQDRHSLSLPGVQLQLVEEVAAAAKKTSKTTPVVVVVMSGGPVDLSPLRDDPNIDGKHMISSVRCMCCPTHGA